MAKNHILKVGIIIAAIAFVTNSLQAQSWTSNSNITVYTQNFTDNSTQKIKEYRSDVLISLSKKNNMNHYCFSAWQDGNNFAIQNFLNDTTIVVSDFTIFEDTVYFCGKRQTSQGVSIGIIGRFNVEDFLGGNNPTYDITDIATAEHLTQLVAYRKPYSYGLFVVAIGYQNLSSNQPGRYVFLCYDSHNSTTDYRTSYGAMISSTAKELFEDICLTDNYVVTVSRIYPQDRYIIRKYELSEPYNNLSSNLFSFPNLTFNTFFNVIGSPIHITSISGDKVAVAVSVYDGQDWSTMMNILDEPYQSTLADQLVYHEDKENRVLELDYSAQTGQLLLLNHNYFHWCGLKQAVTLLDTLSSTPYYTITEFLTGNIESNHLSIVSDNRYALAGIYKVSTSSYLSSMTVRYMPSGYNNCVDKITIQTGITNAPIYSSIMNLGIPAFSYTNWVSDVFNTGISTLNTNCID